MMCVRDHDHDSAAADDDHNDNKPAYIRPHVAPHVCTIITRHTMVADDSSQCEYNDIAARHLDEREGGGKRERRVDEVGCWPGGGGL